MTQNKQNLFSTLARTVLVLSTAAILSGTAFASGGGGGGGGGGFGGGGFGGTPQARPVDQTYEVGKAIYNGRGQNTPKLSYCVKGEGDEIVPLKGKTAKQYKRATYNDFANALYNCDVPENRIAQELEREDFLYVIYYLNKRHRLKLEGS